MSFSQTASTVQPYSLNIVGDNVTVTGCNFEIATGASEASARSCILFKGTDGTTVTDCEFEIASPGDQGKFGRYAVYLLGSSMNPLASSTVTGNELHAVPGAEGAGNGEVALVYGADSKSGNTYTISGVTITGNGTFNETGNVIGSGLVGVSLSGDFGVPTGSSSAVDISGNTFEGSTGVLYDASGATGATQGTANVHGNTFESANGITYAEAVSGAGALQLGDGSDRNTFESFVESPFKGDASVAASGDGKVYVYTSVADAIDTSKGNSSSVTLLQDVTESLDIPEGTTVTIDLNGNALTNAGTADTVAGTLSIKDSVGGGKLLANGGGSANSALIGYLDSRYEIGSDGTLVDKETSSGSASVSGKNFSYDVSKGELTAEDIIELSGAKADVSGAELVVDADELAALNDAISRGLNGTYTVTVSVKGGGAKAEVKVTLTCARTYADVSSGAWYAGEVYEAMSLGYMTGKSASSFDPEGSLTRAEAVETIYKMAGASAVYGKDADPEAGFTDTGDDQWYAESLAWGRERGIVEGYPDGSFRPDASVSREEFAKMLMNYAGKAGEDTSYRGDVSGYGDAS